MSSNPDASILDDALTYIGQRIAAIIIHSAGQDEMYVSSLHNEVLAAAWIIGLLASGGGSPHIPEPVRIAYRCFSDIKNAGTFVAPDEGLVPGAVSTAVVETKFNLTEWWKLAESERLDKPFDVGEELVPELLCALEMRLATAELRSKIISNFKEVLGQRLEIESRIESLKSFLEVDYRRCIEEADRMDDLDA